MKSWSRSMASMACALAATSALAQGEVVTPKPARPGVLTPVPSPAPTLTRPTPAVTQPLAPDQAVAARHLIMAWLECEECTQGELEAVVRLGGVAVPTLGATLRHGPSPASREELNQHLVDSYRQLGEYARTHPEVKGGMSEEQYVATYMGNYVALYGVRSAQALAAIGGPEAAKHLQAAMQYELRADVRAVVADSLKRVRQ